MNYPVLPVAVEMSMDHGDPLYAGTNLTLTCSIDLDEDLVDIPIIVSTSWMKNTTLVISDSTHSVQQPLAIDTTLLTYVATYSFIPLDDNFNNIGKSDSGDSGAYQCDFIVMPNVSNSFVNPRNSSSASNDIAVLGELYLLPCYKSSEFR